MRKFDLHWQKGYEEGLRVGIENENNRIIKLIEEDCECEYHDGYPPMICYPHRLIALIKEEAE